MRWPIIAVALVACGGQILAEPGDAGSDVAAANVDASPLTSEPDAGSDSSPTKDATRDVTLVADEGGVVGPTCATLSRANLLAYYPLDSDTADHSGNGNHATGSNLYSLPGLIDNGVQFDGASSTLQVTSGSAMLAGARTLCMWSQSKPTTGAAQPMFWGGYTNMGDFYSLFSAAPSNTTCTQTIPSIPFVDHWGTDCFEAPLPPIVFSQWTLICYAYDGAAIVMSVNGNENKTIGQLYDYPLTTLFIGSTLGNGTTTKASFQGNVDEVSVWSTRLQSADIAALWNNGAGCRL
jgi:hypothetical protein